jgi:predicted PurR-regulated permease PerM
LVRNATVSTVIAIGVVVAALYFAQEVLIPLALAVLLSFLLAPVVTGLERWKLGRIPAVLVTVAAAFALIFAVGWIVGTQIIGLAESLPQYQTEIIHKAQRFRGKGSGLGANIEHLGQEVEIATGGPATHPADAATSQPTAMQGLAQMIRGTPAQPSTPPPGSTRDYPLFTIPLPAPVSPIRILGSYLGLALGPLGTAGLVIIFVVFMLIEREDLRDRLIRLISRGRYTVTTRALDDAGTRISRYILAQSIINGTYGLTVGLGLWLVGLTFGHGTLFPSFFLWGLLSAVLRFIPYVGAFTAAAFPVTLSLAVYPGFSVFIATAVLLVGIEALTSNILEPWLYGTSTGISTVALMVSAVFWTWLWGPIGLLLATPLTVCIVVLGKHVPQLKFFDVLLGDQPALPPAVSYYQRLLAGDKREAAALVAEVARERGAENVPDEVLIPALLRSRRDRKNEDLSPEAETAILDATSNIVREQLCDLSPGPEQSNVQEPAKILGCPAHHRAEEVVKMLDTVIRSLGCQVEQATTRLLPADIEALIERNQPQVVFIATIPPGGIVQARYLCRRLRRKFRDLPIVVGYWGRVKDFDRLLVRLRAAGASYVTTSLLQTRSQIAAMLKTNSQT